MKRVDQSHSSCPIARSLHVFGDGWSLLLVRDAAIFGRRRFSEFEKSLGAAKNILSARLKMLVDEGIFELVPAPDGSAHREYRLTAKGEALRPVLAAIRDWGDTWSGHERARSSRGRARPR
jgi:DNA-binding HxlR family transcriptional regulator